jgi:hypothetical protein
METNNSNKLKQFTEKLNSTIDNLDFILDEFKKLYVINKMHPNNEEYKSQYENIVSNINNISSNLFILSNDIENNTNNLNKDLIKINNSIKKEKEKNHHLKRKLGIIEHENNSSSIMIDDYKEIYNKNYLKNWSIGLSIILCIYTISVVYKKK